MQTFLHYRWRVPSTLHRLHLRRIIPLLLLALCVTGAKAQYQTYDANTCYTKVLIDAKINDFVGNTKPMGFGTYNSETDVITQPQWKTENGSNRDLAIDYVAGLVAKACIEAADYYKNFTWSKPWFKLVENYATNEKVTVPITGASLDDLNAAKMYFALAELTKPGAKYANSTTYNKAISELNNALAGLTAVNTDYSIRSGSTVNYYSSGKQTYSLVDESGTSVSPTESGQNMNAIGGWYHKATYPNQMWCDSEYMGPALLAQLVAYATKNTSAGIGTVTGTTEGDWKLIAKQFDITWNYLWNSKDQLLYHGFSATPKAIAAHTHTWATGTNGNNAAYWGRAIGWYFLALVDVLENMPDNISDNSYISTQDNLKSKDANIKNRLKSYLADLAAGIWAQRKSDTNLWTNVINEAVDTEHSSYSTTNDAIQSNTKNYLEASASAIYIAAYIKAMRLGLLPETYKTDIKTAYQNYISSFITTDNDIINTCASAGLGGGNVNISSASSDYKSGGQRYRNGTADYYTRGYDVTKVTDYQEGKPLGAFILASTEYERYLKDDYKPSFTAANAEIPTAQTVTKGQSVTLHAAAMAKPLAEYQWYSYPASSTRSTNTQGTLIEGKTSADLTVTPDVNTYYYCVAKNSAGSAQTEPVLVTVSEESNEGTDTPTEKVVTISLANKNTTCTDADRIVTVDVTKSQPGSSSSYCKVARDDYFTVSSTKTITKIVISYEANYVPKKDGAVTVNTGTFVYNTSSTSSTWTGSATSVTFTDDSTNGNDLHITSIEVTYLDGIPSSLSITTQPVGATYDYGVSGENVTDLSVTAEKSGIEGDIAYQWCSNTTNSNTNGTPIDGATSASYKPVVTTAGTTYYYCVVSAGGKSVTSDAVAVAVLNPSNLAIKTQSNYEKNSNAWTPAVGGTISITDIVTSSSMGAYSITTGDAATLDGTSLTAVKDGTITLKQAADDNYKEGSIAITVRIGQDVTSDGSNEYSFTEETNVRDGMTITRENITMTFGNDGFWKQATASSCYTHGQKNPAVTNHIPTSGTFYKFRATTTGSLKVKVRLGILEGNLRPLYVSENGTLIKAKDKDGKELDPNNMPAATTNYEDNIIFPVKANTDYYVYVPGSKLGFFGFTFEPATLYTVTFNAGTNGTCSTTSLMQESANATITLPSVTPKTGYKFAGWYTAAEEEDGTKVESPYKPESGDITLYAHYTSTVSSTVVATFVDPTETTWNEKNNNGFTITGVSNIKSDDSAKLSSGRSITLTIPAGYTVTGFDFTLLCANTTEGSTLSVGDDEISVKDGTHTLHHMNLSSSVTGPTTLTITNSGGKELNILSINVYGSNGKSISFTTHPQDAEYVKGATSVTELTVEAQVNNVTDDVTINYQWYKNTTEKSTDGGTEISNANTSSYTPDVSTAGTTYYYCKATATVGEETLEAYSNIATVTVSNPTLTIVTEPVGATYAQDQTGVEPLMVEAKSNTGRTDFTYQWYKKTSETATASPISGATESEYTPPVDAEGTIYYYCEVKLALESETLEATTNTVSIIVNNEQPIYGYRVSKAGLDAPDINESVYITKENTDGTVENLVKMTFGGWKWNGGTYKKPGSDTPITDTWKNSETVSGVTVLDGYEYWFSGTQDAKQENKDAETEMYGQIRNGWFVSPKRENGITTDSYPYTLPVRGSFMTFEPTKNGTLTIYILQNGAWNTFDKDTQLDGVSYKKGAIKPGEFRMHAFQITNQRGLVLAEFAPNYSVTNKQEVAPEYSCTKYLETDRPSSFDKTSTDVSDWEEFWTLSLAERKAVYDNWSVESNGGCQEIIKLENGSFLAIQKAVVKYQFHVTGNETYYLFSNFSKMGFSGATFQPDAESGQPTDKTTFSGAKSLEDTKAFTKITKTPNGTIGDTGLTNYTYTIDGEEVGKVDGVFIPQFKEITLKRNFTKNQWTTLTLPFNLTQTEVEQIFGTGTQILVFEDAITNGTKLHIKFFYHEIQNILPGYPYLIKPTLEWDDNGTTTQTDNAPTYTIDGNGNLTSFTVYDKAINPHIEQHNFTATTDTRYVAKGTPDYCTADVNGGYSKKYEEGDLFISDTNGTLYISKGESYGKGYRSYIDGPGSSATKTLSLSFSGVEDGEDDGTTTEISVAELADDVIEAFGIKGVYNLNGQKVAETTRNLPAGIYVVNGRKVVVK